MSIVAQDDTPSMEAQFGAWTPEGREMSETIELTPAEIQSGLDRVKWAEGLIRQLPADHDGRNSWLLNYGVSEEAEHIRRENEVRRLNYTPPKYELRHRES